MVPPVVSNVVPFSKPYSQVGIKGDPYIFKGMKLQKDIVTTKEYEEALKNGKKKNWNQTVSTKKN